jgi:hypothetical protein
MDRGQGQIPRRHVDRTRVRATVTSNEIPPVFNLILSYRPRMKAGQAVSVVDENRSST